jgi:hypothetical protein
VGERAATLLVGHRTAGPKFSCLLLQLSTQQGS